jgi:peptidoglycan/xylan/chitin deacetylase (PgdA/CDA1 family)
MLYAVNNSKYGDKYKLRMSAVKWLFKKDFILAKRLSILSVSAAYYFWGCIKRFWIKNIFNKSLHTYTILCYHSVDSSQKKKFIRQIYYLQKKAKAVLLPKDTLNGAGHFATVTFDDGFKNVLDNAYPVMKHFKIQSVLFIPTSFIGKEPDWIQERYNKNLCGMVLTKEQLLAVDRRYIIIGSHGQNHRDLTLLPGDDARKELVNSKSILESMLEQKVDYFAFPYDGYTEDIVKAAKEAGYTKVFAGQSTPVTQNSDTFIMGRIAASPEDWMPEFALKIHGAYNWLPGIISFKNRFFK